MRRKYGLVVGAAALAVALAVAGCSALRPAVRSDGGTPELPVDIRASEYYQGTVGSGGTSYYRYTTESRADVYIEIPDAEGELELVYYGADGSYENWLTASQGSEMNVEDYFVDSGAVLHFTVVDRSEGGGGGSFTIHVAEEYLLAPLGIMMRGDIFTDAVPLDSPSSSIHRIGSEALSYFSVQVVDGPSVHIRIGDLPDYAALNWVDTDGGSYGSAETYGEADGSQHILVSGVGPDTVCLFYVVASQDRADPEYSFTVEVSEPASAGE